MPKYEPQNPDWSELHKWEDDTVEELREIFGERGSWPQDFKFDEEGKLLKVNINRIEEGGWKTKESFLKEEAIAHHKKSGRG